MAVVSMKSLLETGVHFGHRTRKWNPKMKSFIFTERNGIHIIDLQQTLEALETAYALVRDTVAEGGIVLFVGTKRQAQETIELEAKRCGMPYVNSRWLGGTLTNWRTIRSRITELENLEKRREEGEFELLTKKEALNMERKIDKLEERLSGIRNMKRLPDLVFAVDVRREETAIHEANLLEIPVVALVDTNCDPGGVDYVIPSNDDAIRAIKLLTSKVADAVLEGIALRKDLEEEMEGEGEFIPELVDLEMSDEELLGEATLAKLQSGDYDDDRTRGPRSEEDDEDLDEDDEAYEDEDLEEDDKENDEDLEEEGEASGDDDGEEDEPEPEKENGEEAEDAAEISDDEEKEASETDELGEEASDSEKDRTEDKE
jgi:small subunit ribosomal protein S2